VHPNGNQKTIFKCLIRRNENNKRAREFDQVSLLGWSDKMITRKRSDFFYTLEEDERRCLASIERVDQKIKREHKRENILPQASRDRQAAPR
jgi:hypothetical protein